MVDVTDEYLAKFKNLCQEQGITYDTEDEYREAAYNLVNYVDLMLQLSIEHNGWNERLKTEPNGFALPSNGRSCSLCHTSVYGEVWYDKWGMQCLNCHEAFKKKIIPGYVFKDSDNEKHVTDTRLASISGLPVRTIRKLVRQGKIKVRKIPGGPTVILRKENPDLVAIISAEKELVLAK